MRSTALLGYATAALLLGCAFPDARDCTVACDSALDCPGGFVCATVDRVCRPIGVTTACARVLDAGAGSDGSPGDTGSDTTDAISGDAPTSPLVTLRDTQDDTFAVGHSDQCLAGNGTITQAQTYARVFPLTSLGISTGFRVTAVSFLAGASAGVHGAHGVTIAIGTYAGSTGTSVATLDAGQVTQLAALTLDVPDASSPALMTVPIAADVSAGTTLFASVSSPSYVSAGVGLFLVGGTASAQTLPSYLEMPSCLTPDLSDEDGRDHATVGAFVLDVIGHAP